MQMILHPMFQQKWLHKSSTKYPNIDQNLVIISNQLSQGTIVHHQNNQKQNQENINIHFTQGYCYVRGIIGSPNMDQNWLQPTIQQWEILLKVAVKFQQSTNTALTCRLWTEWLYLYRVTPLVSEPLSSVEAAMCSNFLPALSGNDSINHNFRSLLFICAKQAGIVIKDPTTTTAVLYLASCSETNLLVKALLQNL